ncbi:MAG: VanZ family protein [Planctomycetota bacterium]|nr:VanZ family protein [Planctomycetota bacterium]
MRPPVRRWAPAAVWALFLLFLGTRPPDSLPDVEWWLSRYDKVIHAAMYGIAGVLAAWAARLRPAAALLLGALWGAAWGGIDEFLQGRIAGRDADWVDWIADVLGAAAGAWLCARTFPRGQRSSD